MSQDEDWQQSLHQNGAIMVIRRREESGISLSTGRYWKQSGWYCAHPPAMTTPIFATSSCLTAAALSVVRWKMKAVRGDAFASIIGHCFIADMAPSPSQIQSGAPLGVCGHWEPAGWPALELGWSLFDGQEGKGIAVGPRWPCAITAFGDAG